MAEKAQLEISIGADGQVRIVTHGLKGEACLAETKELEKELGSVKSREKTREYYQQEQKAATKARNR